MLRRLKYLFIFITIQFVNYASVYGQQPVYTIDLYNRYLDYRITSGELNPDFILSQPYELKPSYTLDYFSQYSKTIQDSQDVKLWTGLQLRDEQYVNSKTNNNRFRLDGTLYYKAPHIVLKNRTTVDRDYRRDPFFAGDLSESKNWLYGRVNEAYVNLDFNGFSAFFGRTSRNWGAPAEYSLILSDWPYTYDHLLLSYTYKKLRLSVIFARLEQLSALDDTKPGEIINNANKFLTGHRLDLAFSKSFQIALTEMAVYGGAERDFEPSFLNPFTFYYPLQRNDRLAMNGSWALDIFYKPSTGFTFYNQFLIDDIIVNNEPGVDDRSRYPDRFALLSSVRHADLIKGAYITLTYARIWNRVYQSRRTYENYHYRGLGLGYPAASLEEIKLKTEYWNLFPFWLSNTLVYGRYGAVSLTDLFPVQHESFPVKPVKFNLLNDFELQYSFNSSISTYLNFRYLNSPGHYLSRIQNSKGWSARIGAVLNLDADFGYLLK